MKAFLRYHCRYEMSMWRVLKTLAIVLGASPIFLIMFFWTFGWAFADTVVWTSGPNADYQGIGYTPGYPNDDCLASRFIPSASGDVTAISVDLSIVGAPSDSAVVSLLSDSSDSPGGLVETGSLISGASLNGSLQVVLSAFSGSSPVVVSVPMWVSVCRSDVDPSGGNRYMVGLSSEGSWWWNSASWYNPGTSEQIEDVVYVSSGGAGGGGGTPEASSTQATTSLAVLNANVSYMVDILMALFCLALLAAVYWIVLH